MANSKNVGKLTAQQTVTLRLSLLENARDFMDAAVKSAQTDRPSDWKYALLHLAAALELLMKTLLEKEHWSLLFQNVDAASKAALGTGNFKSVDFETALQRLENVAGVALEEKDRQYLRNIREFRNRVMHLHVDVNVEQIKSLVARGITIFIELHRLPTLKSEFKRTYEFQLNKDLAKFQRYVTIKMATLKDRLDRAERPAAPFNRCGECYQEAIVYAGDDQNLKCLYCGARGELTTWIRPEGDGGSCPECEDGTLYFLLYNNEDGEFVCAKCGFKSDYCHNKQCMECGETFWSADGDTICSGCWSYKMSKD